MIPMLGGCLSLALLAALPVYMEVAKPGVSRTRKENTRIRTIIRGLFQGFANMKPPICHSSICVHRSRFVHVIRLSGNEIPSTSLFGVSQPLPIDTIVSFTRLQPTPKTLRNPGCLLTFSSEIC